MKFSIKHEINGRVRIHVFQRGVMSMRQADLLQYYLETLPGVLNAKVYERTADAVIVYKGDRVEILEGVRTFSYDNEELEEIVPVNSGRELNREYQEKLFKHVAVRMVTKTCFPFWLRAVYTTAKAIRYVFKGIRCLLKGKLEVEVLDATAITVSIIRSDFNTAGSVMFLLGIGELLEEWTHKKSVGDLARSMSLNIEKVWQNVDGTEVLVPVSNIKEGDLVTVHVGNVIPLDGEVVTGEAMVNQASMTGESVPVKKEAGSYVYAGTAVEEGEITLKVKHAAGSTRFERIVQMIEDSEKLKSSVEGKAASLADALVPWSLGGTALTWLLTRNSTKALSILMVDFSCALKLAMPLSVLSAMREANSHHITVKGGKFLEAVSEAHTIVFDKTGTLTKAEPVLADIVVFNDMTKNEILRIAACLEEHFPHSMAKAIVRAAKDHALPHKEMHSDVEYVVAHGIASKVGRYRVRIGSAHYIFDDEKTKIPADEQEKFNNLPNTSSHIYLAIGGTLAAVICIKDPVREEAKQVIADLHALGIKKVVMMTGDSKRNAQRVADELGIDEVHAEVLPEDKASYVKQAKADGYTVMMVGDGINDSPAISEAHVGIAMNEGAPIAQKIANVTISSDNLQALVDLRRISIALMKRIKANYNGIVGFNGALVGGGVLGIMPPSQTAWLHNLFTLGIGLESMTPLLKKDEPKETVPTIDVTADSVVA